MSRILLIGSGDARDHATYKRLRDEAVDVRVALLGQNGLLLGSPGVDRVPSLDDAVTLATRLRPDVVLVQRPEFLLDNLVDRLAVTGARVIGPPRRAAQLEGSKVLAKRLMDAHGVATPPWRVFERPQDAAEFLQERWPRGERYAIKADRYLSQAHLRTATPSTLTGALDALAALAAIPAGTRGEILIERWEEGPELSVHLLLDGRGGSELAPPVCDYKPLLDGDRGPNTHGMGAVAATRSYPSAIEARIVSPTLAAIAAEGLGYCGVLYIGVLLTAEGPVALEYNVRPGNPEWPTLLPLLAGSLAETLGSMADGAIGRLVWRPLTAATVFVTVPGYPFIAEEHSCPVGGLANLLEAPDITVLGEGIRPGLQAGTGRSLALVSAAGGFDAVRERLYAGVALVRFPGMHWRTDIGRGRAIVDGACP